MVQVDRRAAPNVDTAQDRAKRRSLEAAIKMHSDPESSLLSQRIEAESGAEPDDDGMIPITIVPDKNDLAITTSRVLALDEAQAHSAEFEPTT